MRISLQNLSKSFGGNAILNDFSLEIPSGARLCLCGYNGSGKSTLIKILAGKEQPDGGKITLQKDCRLGYVEQELDAHSLQKTLLGYVLEVLPDWSGFWEEWEQATEAEDAEALARLGQRQAELEAIYGYNPEHRAKAVLSGLGFAQHKWHRTLQELSGGWRERAKLARVLTQGADVLLLDEPTNHLDLDAVEWLEAFLLDYEGTLVFVAHDRVFMDKISTHILCFSGNGKPLFRRGNFTHFIALQEEMGEQRAREAARLQDEIQKKMDFVRRFKAKASKARQAGSKQKMAKRMEKELEGLQPEARRRNLSFSWPTPPQADRTVLSVADLAFSFPDGKRMWSPLSFSLYRGQKIGLVGPNGCGKSTLLRLLAGRLEKDAGNIVFGQLVRLGYFSQHQLDTLNAGGSALSEIRRLSDPRMTEEELMSVMGLFQLGQNFFERQVSSLSGGERSRLMLATLFLSRSNFLVLDEPTNHLDLESREALVEALCNFEGTLLMVAHDRHLLAEAADEIWELGPTGFTTYVHGFADYDVVRRRQRQLTAEKELDEKRGAVRRTTGLTREELKQQKRDQAEARKKLSAIMKPLQQKAQKAEAALDELLTRQDTLEKTLADPAVYADGPRAGALLKEFHEVQTKVEAAMLALEAAEQALAPYEEQRKALAGDDTSED